jgi:hypothetical protein
MAESHLYSPSIYSGFVLHSCESLLGLCNNPRHSFRPHGYCLFSVRRKDVSGGLCLFENIRLLVLPSFRTLKASTKVRYGNFSRSS